MQKPPKTVRCTLLTGSAWCTEKSFLRRYKGTFDIFFGIRTQDEKRGGVGAVQQRGRARMEVCSRRSNQGSYAHFGRSFFGAVESNLEIIVGKEEEGRVPRFHGMKEELPKHG